MALHTDELLVDNNERLRIDTLSFSLSDLANRIAIRRPHQADTVPFRHSWLMPGVLQRSPDVAWLREAFAGTCDTITPTEQSFTRQETMTGKRFRFVEAFGRYRKHISCRDA